MITLLHLSHPKQMPPGLRKHQSFRCAKRKTGACKEPLEWRASFCDTWRFDFGARQGLKMGKFQRESLVATLCVEKTTSFYASNLRNSWMFVSLLPTFLFGYTDVLWCFQINWISKGYIFRRTKKQNRTKGWYFKETKQKTVKSLEKTVHDSTKTPVTKKTGDRQVHT